MTMRSDFYPSGAVNVTPGATQLNLCGFTVGGAGTVIVADAQGNSTTFTCVAGQTVMCRIVAITGGTATGIVGFLAI